MRYDCLIIDDEKMLADNTCEYFNMFEVKTAVCYSAKEATDFLMENEAALILLDINLGDGSGFELCKRIRTTMNIPILFVSARKTDDDKIIALNIGGDDYIEKPYSLGVLLAKVKVISTVPSAVLAVNFFSAVTSLPFTRSAFPVALSIRIPLTTYSLPGTRLL